MSLINLTLVLVAVLNVGMAILILLRNPKNKINISFSLAVLSIGLWSFGEAMLRQSTSEFTALFWGKAENIFGFSVPVFFLYFSLNYPYKSFKLKPAYKVLFFLIIVSALGNIMSSIYIYKAIVQPPSTDFLSHFWGMLYFSFSFCFILISAFIILTKKYFLSQGLIKKNLLSILFATGVLGAPGTFFGVIYPMFTGKDNPWFAPIFSIPMVFVLVWFIFRKE